MDNKKILGYLFPYPRFIPTIFAIFIGSILLLFIQNIGHNIKTFLIPSIFVYAMATALLGTLHRLLGMHYFRPKIIVKIDDNGPKMKLVEFDFKKNVELEINDRIERKKRILTKYSEIELDGEIVGDIKYYAGGINNNEKPIPIYLRIVILIMHLILFALLIIYNFHHCSLSW